MVRERVHSTDETRAAEGVSYAKTPLMSVSGFVTRSKRGDLGRLKDIRSHFYSFTLEA